jgi:hypothetical protein
MASCQQEISTLRAVVVLALSLVLALPAQGAKPRPALALKSAAPLTITGKGFAPREAVLLTATFSSHRRFAGPVAGRDGTFTARFNVRITKCTNLVVRAIGGRGSRAILRTKVACTKKRGPSEGPPREPKPAKQ